MTALQTAKHHAKHCYYKPKAARPYQLHESAEFAPVPDSSIHRCVQEWTECSPYTSPSTGRCQISYHQAKPCGIRCSKDQTATRGACSMEDVFMHCRNLRVLKTCRCNRSCHPRTHSSHKRPCSSHPSTCLFGVQANSTMPPSRLSWRCPCHAQNLGCSMRHFQRKIPSQAPHSVPGSHRVTFCSCTWVEV
jgi:hypothetical protein